ncbi:MAG: transglutaminase-like domain-containing protein [Anaerovoracaceae bacterium]
MINASNRTVCLIVSVILAMGIFSACGAQQISLEPMEVPLYNQPEKRSLLMPEKSGIVTFGNNLINIDASNTSQGYLMIKYNGKNAKIKVQISKEGKATYTYDLNSRDAYEIFPLSEGSGKYGIKVFENISGNQYSQAYGKTIDVKLQDEFVSFLYPNQYVNYTVDSEVVKKGMELTAGTDDSLGKLKAVYNYVVDNFTYDYSKAKSVQSGYLPKVDEILASKKGICFDYAAVMVSMLRSQNIPSKLVVGYTGEIYHAWVNVYLKEKGWVDAAIFFDGERWQLMDPTFASSGGRSQKVMEYIKNEANYVAKYCY